MSTGNGEDPQQALHRLEELIRALDAHPDPAAKETARELLALVLDLHGIGLAKLMGIVATAEGGTAILARLAENEQVQAMLLLHGLPPGRSGNPGPRGGGSAAAASWGSRPPLGRCGDREGYRSTAVAWKRRRHDQGAPGVDVAGRHRRRRGGSGARCRKDID